MAIFSEHKAVPLYLLACDERIRWEQGWLYGADAGCAG